MVASARHQRVGFPFTSIVLHAQGVQLALTLNGLPLRKIGRKQSAVTKCEKTKRSEMLLGPPLIATLRKRALETRLTVRIWTNYVVSCIYTEVS